MKVLFSAYPIVVFFKVVDAQKEGNTLKVEDKLYKVRPLNFKEYLLACFVWIIPLFLVVYLYFLPYLLDLKILPLAVLCLPFVLFLVFAAKGINVVGAVLLVLPVFLVPFPSFLFDYVAGFVAGGGAYVLYLFGERGYRSENGGEVFALWKE